MNSVPNDLRGLLRLLEEAGGQEETWRRVRLPNGHLVRLTHADDGEWRLRYGFKPVSVSLLTPATEKAIVAALAALKGKTTEPRRMHYASALLEDFDKTASGEFDSLEAMSEYMRNDPRLEGALGADLRNVPVARLVKELLRHYRPEFDELPEHRRVALMEQAAGHLNEFLDALRKLTAFLEAGDSTAGIPKTKLKVTQEQLQAAELADVVGLSHREIATALGLPPPTGSDERQGGHQKAKERVREGRKLFREAFGGQEGYRSYVEQQKQEARRWESLSTEERYAEDFGESCGIPAKSMLIIMTGDLEAAQAEVAKLGPEKADEAAWVRAIWEYWDLSDDPDSPLTPRSDMT
jgi:hypothetical protein